MFNMIRPTGVQGKLFSGYASPPLSSAQNSARNHLLFETIRGSQSQTRSRSSSKLGLRSAAAGATSLRRERNCAALQKFGASSWTSLPCDRKSFCKRRGESGTCAFSGVAGVSSEEDRSFEAWQEKNAPRRLEIRPLTKALQRLTPFLQSEGATIIRGWMCCCVAVGCLFFFVPLVGVISSLLSNGDLQQLGQKTTIVAALVGVRSLAQYWQQALLWEAVLNVTFKVRRYVFKEVMQRDMGFFEGRRAVPAGDVAYRISSESEDMADSVYYLLHTMVPSALQLIAMSTRMITLSPLLAAATFTVVPGMAVVIALLGERLRKLARKGQESIAKLSAFLTEVLPSMFVIKAHAAEELEQWHFDQLAWTERSAQLGKKRMKAFIPEMITLVYVITAVVILAVGTWAISRGTFDGAGMVSFMTSLVLLVEPMQALGRAYNEMKNGEPAIERLFEFTAVPPVIVEKAGALSLENVRGVVELKDVSFRYDEHSPWVLNNVSFSAYPGETIALVGSSGGGKTTLAKLLLRLYDPIHGNIVIDGCDIKDFSLRSLRKNVAIVPQETVSSYAGSVEVEQDLIDSLPVDHSRKLRLWDHLGLFIDLVPVSRAYRLLVNGTVAENIAYGEMPQNMNINAVVRSAKLANADEFIQKLPSGYSTNLGDRASSLSGGQRQRLAIARAIYQEATILILDEATSALDNKSESLVREALERLTTKRTVIVIAHRLETVQRANRILFLDGGRIVEEGTHLSLLRQGGKYASLYTRKEPSLAMPETVAG